MVVGQVEPRQILSTSFSRECFAQLSQIATPIGMQMVFTTSYVGAPILFQQWTPSTTGGFVGSFFAIVVAAFVMRLLIFARSYLNSEYWGRSKVSSTCGIAV